MFALFAQLYGWDADTCSNLTPAQTLMYTQQADNSSKFPMPYSEWKATRGQGIKR